MIAKVQKFKEIVEHILEGDQLSEKQLNEK